MRRGKVTEGKEKLEKEGRPNRAQRRRHAHEEKRQEREKEAEEFVKHCELAEEDAQELPRAD